MELTCLAAYPNAMRPGDVVGVYGRGDVTLVEIGPPAPGTGLRSATVEGTDEPVELDTGSMWTIYRPTDGLTAEEQAAALTGIPLGSPE